MHPTHENFSFESLTFSSTTKVGKMGGKYVSVGYDGGKQVFFQLGKSPLESLRSPFGAELANRDDPDSGMVMKIELSSEVHGFITKFEDYTKEAAEANSMEWFNRATPNATYNSNIKEQSGDRPDVLKVKVDEDTMVQVVTVKDGKIVGQVAGTVNDITKGSLVLPVIKIKGGVYFFNRTYGTSFVARAVMVIKEKASKEFAFDLGGVEVVNAEMGSE